MNELHTYFQQNIDNKTLVNKIHLHKCTIVENRNLFSITVMSCLKFPTISYSKYQTTIYYACTKKTAPFNGLDFCLPHLKRASDHASWRLVINYENNMTSNTSLVMYGKQLSMLLIWSIS